MQNYLVYGLGASGVAAANFIAKNGDGIFVFDKNKKLAEELKENCILPKDCIILDKLCANSLCIVHCIVLSPGIKLNKKEINLIREYHIRVVGELSFASEYCTAPIYAITGTNGKTTTVNILHHIFKTAKENSFLVGNVGNAFCGEVDKIAPKDRVVCEVSSFQLENAESFRPFCVGFLNISPDHLDRYKDFNEYFEVKKLILDKVDASGKIFLNFDEDNIRVLGENRENVEYFSLNILPKGVNGVFITDNTIYRQDGDKKALIASLDKIKLMGNHNLSNILCAVGMAIFAGVMPQVIQKSINSFKPLNHRLEKVCTKNGVDFYNDSKATNTKSTLTALECFKDKKIWLLLGGSDKGEKFNKFFYDIKEKVSHIITFGEMGKKLFKMAKKQKIDAKNTKNLFDCVNLVKKLAKSGEIVLFSPACASFDEFQNYVERGNYFKNLLGEND